MAKKSLNYIKDKYTNNVNFLGEVEVNSFVSIIRSNANRNEEEDIMGNRFVFNNPNAEFKCGCGSSFG